MNRHPLSDEETVVILSSEVRANLETLDGDKQRQVLARLHDIASSEVPPSAFRRERISNLDIIAAGDTIRLYTALVEHVPQGNTEYHVIYVFFVDDEHAYRRRDLASYSRSARSIVDAIRSFEHVDRVDEYLRSENALSASDLADLLEED